MTTETLKTYPHATDLNRLADVYEKNRYDFSLEAGDFHSQPTVYEDEQPSTGTFLGYVAAAYTGPQHPSVLPSKEVK